MLKSKEEIKKKWKKQNLLRKRFSPTDNVSNKGKSNSAVKGKHKMEIKN